MDADARLRGDLQVANARVAIAGAKDKQFAIKQQDYLRRAQANSSLMGAGIQNVVGAGQNMAMMDMMKQYYDLNKGGGGDDAKKSIFGNYLDSYSQNKWVGFNQTDNEYIG